jgi:hypothetical protein
MLAVLAMLYWQTAWDPIPGAVPRSLRQASVSPCTKYCRCRWLMLWPCCRLRFSPTLSCCCCCCCCAGQQLLVAVRAGPTSTTFPTRVSDYGFYAALSAYVATKVIAFLSMQGQGRGR